MAPGVSRFPETPNIPTIIYAALYKDDGRAPEREGERERDTKKHKGSFQRLFSWKNASKSKEREGHRGKEQQQYHRLRINSFHPEGSALPSNSMPLSPVERVRTIETSTPTLPHVADRRPNPPKLSIPRAGLNNSRSQPDLIFPPTPKIMDFTTRDTIKALGLFNNPLPKAARVLPTNPAIFGDGMPTFPTASPISPYALVNNPSFYEPKSTLVIMPTSPVIGVPIFPAGSPLLSAPNSPYSIIHSGSTSSFSEPKSTPGSAVWYAKKPLPPVPTPSPPPTFKRVGASAAAIDAGAVIQPPSESESSVTRAGEHSTRGTKSNSRGRGRGRGRALPLLIIPPYKHRKAVISVTPQSPDDSRSRETRDAPALAIKPAVNVPTATAPPPPPAVVIILPTPAVGNNEIGTLVPQPESQPNRRVPSGLSSASSRPDPPPIRPLPVSGRRVQGPRGPRLRVAGARASPSNLSGSTTAQPLPPRSWKASHKGPGSTMGLEKRSGSIKGKGGALSGRGKSSSRAQDGVRKQRPFLAPLNTSLSSLSVARASVARGQQHSKFLRLADGDKGQSDSLRPGGGSNVVVSNTANAFRGDEVVSKSNEFREQSLDIQNILSQLRETRISVMV
jgi:hypothetical protein